MPSLPSTTCFATTNQGAFEKARRNYVDLWDGMKNELRKADSKAITDKRWGCTPALQIFIPSYVKSCCVFKQGALV